MARRYKKTVRKTVKKNGEKIEPPDPSPDDGVMFTDGDDHPSLPDPQPGGGRGEKWPFPPTSTRCKKHSRLRTVAARAAGLIGSKEMRRCRRPSTKGESCCRWHGKVKSGWHGPPSIGAAEGRYSKSLGRFREAYEESLVSRSLFDLREGLAVLDSLAKRCMERVEQLDTPQFRRASLEMLDVLSLAIQEGNVDATADALQALSLHLRRGAQEDSSINLLASTVETLQKRVEKAWEIKLKNEETMNVRDMVGVLGMFVNVVLEECQANLDPIEGEAVAKKIAYRVDTMIRGFGLRGVKKPRQRHQT